MVPEDWRLRLIPRVEDGYNKLRMVCEPGVINPAKPGNVDFMKSDARDTVNPLVPHLTRAGFFPPAECSVTNDRSLNEWFRFLGRVRTVLSASRLFPAMNS